MNSQILSSGQRVTLTVLVFLIGFACVADVVFHFMPDLAVMVLAVLNIVILFLLARDRKALLASRQRGAGPQCPGHPEPTKEA